MGTSLIKEINLFRTNGIFQKGLIQFSRDSPLYIMIFLISKIYGIYFFEEIHFALSNSGDLDEMLHNAAFHLGLYCLPKYLLRGY